MLVIDDIMMFPLEKNVAVGLFNLINLLHEKASFIITTNKSPEEWVKMLDDEVLATAILDRLLFRCEVVKLNGKSYRLKNRKTIFSKQDNVLSFFDLNLQLEMDILISIFDTFLFSVFDTLLISAYI